MDKITWKTKPVVPETFLSGKDYHPILRQLLYNREIPAENADGFLNPTLQDLHSPLKLLDMEKAVERIRKAVVGKEKVLIHGDYDADGVSSTVVLLEALWALGANAEHYIPHRDKDGYGMNKKKIAKLAEAYDLIITVDCGVTNHEEIELAKKNGADVIVTDHHQVLEIGIPKAHAVINPNRPDDKYPFKGLAGVGVAFKLAHVLAKLIDPAKIKIDKFFDLVAIATIGDVMPLQDENRALVKTGLSKLWATERRGLRELFQYAGTDIRGASSTDIAFRIVPRINAAGRMDHADLAVDLLSATDENQARELAYTLHKHNTARQDATCKIMDEAQAQLNHDDLLHFVVGDDWSTGIVGLVAGRMMEEHNRPVIVASRKGDVIQGSSRSILGFDIMQAISKFDKLLTRHGGHASASGFELPNKNLDEFSAGLKTFAKKQLKPEDLTKTLDVDAEIKLSDLSFELLEQLDMLEPYGQGNPAPVFALENIQIAESRAVGSDKKHLKLRLTDGNNIYDAIAFQKGDLAAKIKTGNTVDVAGRLSINEWNGNRKLQVEVEDIKT